MPALFVSYSGVLGGAERLLLDMAEGLPETPSLACPEGALAERARAAGLHVFALPERRLELRASARDRLEAPLRIAALARELRALVDALRPDVVVAWGMRPMLAAAAVKPPVLFLHNDLLPGPAIARAVRAAARRADVIVCSSQCIADDLGIEGAHVIHPGVDLERFTPSPPGDHVLVLGAIVDWKRPDLALEITARLPDVRLRIGGEPLGEEGGQLLERLRRRASQPDLAGRVEFAGPVDAAEALADAACLLHCADREPFGYVLVEALATGKPVVAPNSCGPAEIVDDSCGRLYPPGDAAAAAQALEQALSDPQPEAARARAEHFDVRESRKSFAALTPDTRRPTPNTQLALVTVTHNSEQHLERFLRSVESHLPGARVIVVDSGSSDGSADLARRHGAHVIELSENVGFGRANNIGVAEVHEPVTVLVNPDVELLDSSLAALPVEPDRILAPLVLLPDGTRQDSAQAEPGGAAALAIALIPPAAMPPPLRRSACPWTERHARPVGWAVGCCLAARTDTLRRLGPFDESIFLYGEDLELGLRAHDQGVETWFWPDARVLHHQAHSSERAFRGEPFEMLAVQRRSVVKDRRGAGKAKLDDVLQLTTFANRVLLKSIARRDTGRERDQIRALRKARRA